MLRYLNAVQESNSAEDVQTMTTKMQEELRGQLEEKLAQLELQVSEYINHIIIEKNSLSELPDLKKNLIKRLESKSSELLIEEFETRAPEFLEKLEQYNEQSPDTAIEEGASFLAEWFNKYIEQSLKPAICQELDEQINELEHYNTQFDLQVGFFKDAITKELSRQLDQKLSGQVTDKGLAILNEKLEQSLVEFLRPQLIELYENNLESKQKGLEEKIPDEIDRVLAPQARKYFEETLMPDIDKYLSWKLAHQSTKEQNAQTDKDWPALLIFASGNLYSAIAKSINSGSDLMETERAREVMDEVSEEDIEFALSEIENNPSFLTYAKESWGLGSEEQEDLYLLYITALYFTSSAGVENQKLVAKEVVAAAEKAAEEEAKAVAEAEAKAAAEAEEAAKAAAEEEEEEEEDADADGEEIQTSNWQDKGVESESPGELETDQVNTVGEDFMEAFFKA